MQEEEEEEEEDKGRGKADVVLVCEEEDRREDEGIKKRCLGMEKRDDIIEERTEDSVC